MKSKIDSTYFDFLDDMKKFTDRGVTDANEIMSQFVPRSNLNDIYPAELLFLVDYAKHSFLVISNSNSFLGYTTQYLMDAGPSFLYGIRHPGDFKVFNNKIFPLNMSFIKKHLCDDDIGSYIFTTNYRLKSLEGNWLSISQRSRYIKSSSDGTPLVSIDSLSDISNFKKNSEIVNIIEKVMGPQKLTKIQVDTFSPDEQEYPISKREINVLRCICDGMSSKQIAEKLNISIHTINNHRKNMLGKTNCKNLSELAARAIRTGIL